MGNAIVSLANVSRSFAGNRVLDQLSLNLYAGEATAILGHNGSGKSTLLKIIAGLGKLDAGERRLSHPGAIIGFVPDRFPKIRFTAGEYLRGMGRMQGVPLSQLDGRMDELFELFRLDRTAKQHMRHYSKGMLQKVNLMQAMLRPPDLLLLDEPLSGLDRQTRADLMEALLQLKHQGVTLALSTHDRELADRVADRVVTLLHGRIDGDSSRETMDSARPLKRIVCLLPARVDSGTLHGMQGVRHWKSVEEGDAVIRATLEVDAGRCDRLIAVILEAGGSIDIVDSVAAAMPLLSHDRTQSGRSKEDVGE